MPKMMRQFCISAIYLICFFWAGNAFAKLKDDVQEKTMRDLAKLQKAPPAFKIYATAGTFVGYDTNVKLATDRKGDIFEEALFSFSIQKPFNDGLKLAFDYDLDVLNYNEVTDASSILNHFRLGPSKRFAKYFTLGFGYDLGIFYYPKNDDATFFLHRGFLYLTQDINKKTYHRVQFYYGDKYYTDGKAMGDTIGSYQDKERQDKRLEAEYKISSALTKKLRLTGRTSFLINNSNARYLDFYDYKSYGQSLGVDYQLLKQLKVFMSFSYTRKLYNTRTVTNGDYKEVDGLYVGNAGLTQKLNKNNLVTLLYTYRQNASNDTFERYSESVVNCGWQYIF